MDVDDDDDDVEDIGIVVIAVEVVEVVIDELVLILGMRGMRLMLCLCDESVDEEDNLGCMLILVAVTPFCDLMIFVMNREIFQLYLIISSAVTVYYPPLHHCKSVIELTIDNQLFR